MNAWLLYALGGMATLTGVLVDHWRRGGRFGPGDADLARILEAEHGIPAPTWRWRVVERCIVMPLAAVAVVVAWPLALWLLFNDRIQSRRVASRSTGSGKIAFMPTEEHLIERITREAIEARERVIDPLGAVPEVPFGHLNLLWQAFTDGIEAGDELWRPLGQTSCRLVRIKPPGAIVEERSGEIRTSLQGQSGCAAVAA